MGNGPPRVSGQCCQVINGKYATGSNYRQYLQALGRAEYRIGLSSLNTRANRQA